MKNEVDKYLKILSIIGNPSVTIRVFINENIINEMIKSIQNNTCEVVSKKWTDSFKNKDEYQKIYPITLDKFEFWKNFKYCKFNLEIIENKLHSEVCVYGSDYLDNVIEIVELKIIFPLDFIITFSNQLQWQFDQYCEEQHELYLKEQKQDWIKKFSEKILK